MFINPVVELMQNTSHVQKVNVPTRALLCLFLGNLHQDAPGISVFDISIFLSRSALDIWNFQMSCSTAPPPVQMYPFEYAGE